MIEASRARTSNVADRCLKDAATIKLLSGTGTPPGIVTAEARDGWILLSGEVDYRFQQQAVASQLEGLEDARGVRNGVTIRPRTGRTIWDDFLRRDAVCGTDKLDAAMLRGSAERSECYAEAALVVALAGVDQAERAMLSAGLARGEAEAALSA